MKDKYRKFRDRMDEFAYRVGEIQAKVFLTIFYYTTVPIAHTHI